MSEQELAAPGEAADDIVMANENAETDEATAGQAEGQPAEGEEGSPEDKEKTRSQERRERRRQHEQRLREEADAARTKEQELNKRRERLRAARDGEAAPKAEDFSDQIDYAAARALYAARQQDAQRQDAEIEQEATEHRNQAQELETQRIKERITSLEEQKAEARSTYTDFDQTFADAYIPKHVAQILIDSDQAADIGYHLGKNPALARQIAALPPLAIARELGRIEAKLTMPKPKTQSAAPDPITPVKPGGLSRKDPGAMSPQEFAKWRDAGGTF